MKGIDYQQFELELEYEDANKRRYVGKDAQSTYTFYKLFPGIELMHCQFDNQRNQWTKAARYSLPKYMQIAYSHHGVFELEIHKGKTIWCGPGIYTLPMMLPNGCRLSS